ncbi:TetR/AcrR family transcriptional regulator [Rhabdothermincola sediminis]|uniref:TetR/AcrR family transcriptional regulator n=1 Tax=Rhabdothermincola sediminis TaxID=2751370 RepID=UPI001AA07E56|nr:TetR/AcrR family transcriptional regulator [Rhabdothermincola sediminis]
MKAPVQVPTDGRSARATRTRAAIVEALLTLLDEGHLQPTATRIAQRAGISQRLIYHHFGDLEALYRAAAERQAERMAAMVQHIPSELPFEERLARFVLERSRVLESMTPVRRASLLQEPFSPALRRARAAFNQRSEQRIVAVFGHELDRLDHEQRATTLAALAAAGGWACWDALRSTGRTIEQARAVMLLTYTRLLAG